MLIKTNDKLNNNLKDEKRKALTANYYYRLGIYNGDKKDFKTAIDNFTDAIKLDPTNLDSYRMRGIACSIVGNYNQALIDFTLLILKNPADSEAYNRRSRIKYLLGDKSGASSDALRAKILKR